VKMKIFGLLVAMGCALGVQPAAAATATFFASGNGNDGPLSATAGFIPGAGSLIVTISNTLAPNQIVSAGQAVSDLTFTLSNAPGTLGATTASGTFATFNGTTTPTLTLASSPSRWLGQGAPPPNGTGSFSIVGNTITMEAIGGRSAKSDDLTFGLLPECQRLDHERHVQSLC
jgi:hypothetical protein